MSQSPASKRTDPLGIVGTTIDERYVVLELADEGGYGYVYKARRVMWDKPVAIKLFKHKGGDPHKREISTKAFIAESAVLSELSRKTTAIVQSFDIGTLDRGELGQLLYMALEWLEGSTLEELMLTERETAGGDAPWPVERIIDTLQPVAVALAIAHSSGVAHRDVKPANIFLIDEGGSVEGTTKLLDFGVAKVVEDLAEGFDKTGHTEGPYTPKYGAPEQFAKRHGPTGPWSDVYSLSMVCVELLAGRYPIKADGFGSLIFAVCDPKNRPTPRALGVSVSDGVEAVFARALNVKSDGRFRDAGEFWRALLEAAGISASTFPVSPGGRSATMKNPPSLDMVMRPTPVGGSTTADPASVSFAQPQPASWRVGAVIGGLVVLVAGGVAAAWLALTQAEVEVSPPPAPVASAAPSASGPSATIDPQQLASFGSPPEAIVSQDNPLSEPKIALGRMLFFDARLSKGGDVSCNTCHQLDRFGADGKRVSTGTASQPGVRNTPTVYNAAGALALMWDGRASNVEDQTSLPIFNPVEHGMTDAEVVRRLESIPGYAEPFAAAFPEEKAPISFKNVGRAIGAFERKLVTPARFDKFLAGDDKAMTDEEKRGFNAFLAAGCASCHFGPYVGANMFQKLGLLRAWPDNKDRGRFEITKRPEDMMVFRVPSLRNVVETGPYFHDGSVASLPEAVQLMARHQAGKEIGPAEVKAIVAWLGTLTGVPPSDYIRKPELP
jgi:cytochrome c peroxidase